MNEVLFEQVKRKLNITWQDPDTDTRLEEIITSVIPSLNHKLGVAGDFDYSVSGQENNLFLNYCLYEWNHCANEFDDNYSNEIAQIRQKNDVIYYQSTVGGVDNEEE